MIENRAIEQAVEITNKRGLHARASAKFVTAVARLPEAVVVQVSKDDNTVTGTSIMGLMMLGAARGDTITISVEGERAEAVLKKLVGLVMDGFGED
jgi:phosphocarrier protein HPr